MEKTFELLRDGWYPFQVMEVTEKTTKNGHPMVNCKCQIINDPRYTNRWVFHNVTFLPKDNKGAGIAVHFLKSIGEPWEGDVEIDPQAWVFNRAKFMGKVGKREYNGKTYNEIKEISPFREDAVAETTVEEETPF